MYNMQMGQPHRKRHCLEQAERTAKKNEAEANRFVSLYKDKREKRKGERQAAQQIQFTTDQSVCQLLLSMFGEILYFSQKQPPFFVYICLLQTDKLCGTL